MRSTRPSARRPHHRGGASRPLLAAVAGIVDQATAGRPGHVLVHLEGPIHPEVALALRPIGEDVHPFAVLAGVTAPASWSAFGIRASGRARRLDEPHAPRERTAATFLVDRSGEEASVLRIGAVVSEPRGPAAGTIPDVARRVLGLPTPPPDVAPATLWTALWLDRVLETWSRPADRRPLTASWGAVAVLHPAVAAPGPLDERALADPAALVAAARSHAAATSWADLRRSPQPLALPGGALEPEVAGWMDDGFFCRWSLGAFPPVEATAVELAGLLGPDLGRSLLEVVAAGLR